MKLTSTAVALALASATFMSANPVAAQDYGQPQTPPSAAQPQTPPTTAKPSEKAPGFTPTVSKGAQKQIAALQEAVNAKDAAKIAAALPAAREKAKTKDDHYVIAQLQLKAAVDAKDEPGMIAGLEAVLATGALPPADALLTRMDLGKIYYNAKAYDRAATAFEQVLADNPNNVDALVILAETRNNQGRTPDAISAIQRAISARVAAGQKAEEAWYKRAVALSYNAKLPTAPSLARDWVAAYPSPKNWRDTIRIYQTSSQLDDASLIDSMRLARAVGALQGENDYFGYANRLVKRGFAGEAKAVLDEGFASKAIDRSKAMFSQLYTLASSRSQGDRATLAASATAAQADANAKKAMTTAEAYYGYGDYREAAELLRAALTKSGVDKDLANLRLGMALARAGDKAAATAALNAVGGAHADVAKLWLTYLQTRA